MCKAKTKNKTTKKYKLKHQNLSRGTISFYPFLTITFCSCVINGGGYKNGSSLYSNKLS